MATPVRKMGLEDARADLRRQLTLYERIYEMSSEDMLAAVRSGARNDTAEIARWLVLYRLHEHLIAR